jgi:hypothetical protein
MRNLSLKKGKDLLKKVQVASNEYPHKDAQINTKIKNR